MSVTTLLAVLPLPATADPNVRALAQEKVERFTGSTSTTLTCTNSIIAGAERVFKNGALLDPDAATPDYTVSATTITLASAPLATDVFRVFYFFRT